MLEYGVEKEVQMSPGFIDEIGNRHGRLIVIERAKHKKGKPARWKCSCDCGKTTEVDGTLLRNGNTRSCGCLALDAKMYGPPRNSITRGEGAFNALYANYRNSARIRKLEWQLDKPTFRKLTKGNCHYCGTVPSLVVAKNYNGSYSYNGVDRIDNSIGYVPGNVVPCCGVCNRLKGTLSDQDFMTQIGKIVACQYGIIVPKKVRRSGTFSQMDSHKPQLCGITPR